MSVDFKHPDWSDRIDEWIMLRATMRGAKEVQQVGREISLPMPNGFRSQIAVLTLLTPIFMPRHTRRLPNHGAAHAGAAKLTFDPDHSVATDQFDDSS
jgi:hypothetical protein